MRDKAAIEEIVGQLKAEGWREQREGMVYINGTFGTNLLKDDKLISIQQELRAHEEVGEEGWGPGIAHSLEKQ